MSKPVPIIVSIVALVTAICGGVFFWRRRPEWVLRRWYLGPRRLRAQYDRVDYMRITPDEVQKLQTLTGITLTGFASHSIAIDETVHALNRHGRDPLPITDADILRVPFFIKNAQRIRKAQKLTRKKLEAIEYLYKDANGVTTVVEEIRTGRKRLAFKTMYKNK